MKYVGIAHLNLIPTSPIRSGTFFSWYDAGEPLQYVVAYCSQRLSMGAYGMLTDQKYNTFDECEAAVAVLNSEDRADTHTRHQKMREEWNASLPPDPVTEEPKPNHENA